MEEYRIFISGVSSSITEADVREYFSHYGPIANCCKIDKQPTKNFTVTQPANPLPEEVVGGARAGRAGLTGRGAR